MARVNTEMDVEKTMPPPEVQKSEIKATFDIQMKPDQEWCVIDYKWYQMWQLFVNFDGDQTGDQPAPGALDNSSLLESKALFCIFMYILM